MTTNKVNFSIDKSNLRQVILDSPNQFLKALEFSKDIKIKGKFNQIIICGMGGSALTGDILKTYLAEKKINLSVFICRDYNLPFFADKNTLIFASSYSGNTEETISCFQEAKKKKLNIIGFSKNGRLEKLCRENNIPFVKYPNDGPNFQPRFALGYSFTSFVSVLINQKIIKDCRNEIKNLAKYLFNLNLELENEGKKIAKKLAGKIPLIYSSSKYSESVARIIKIKFNECSKTQAFYNKFPELNHNEMVGFTKLQGNYYIIILKDPKDHPRNIKRMEITSQLLQKKGIPLLIYQMKGKNILEKIFSTIILGDWISYYLALEYKQDPTPVKMVEDFKKRLGKYKN